MKKNFKLKKIYKKLLFIAIFAYVLYIFIGQQKTLNSYKNTNEYYTEQINKQLAYQESLTAKKDNMEYLVVILGAPEPTNDINYRDIDCKTLFEYGFLNYENLISAQKRAITFLNNYASFVIDINTILKISLGVLSALFVFTILYKKNKTKKFENSEDIFNFRCSFW